MDQISETCLDLVWKPNFEAHMKGIETIWSFWTEYLTKEL